MFGFGLLGNQDFCFSVNKLVTSLPSKTYFNLNNIIFIFIEMLFGPKARTKSVPKYKYVWDIEGIHV